MQKYFLPEMSSPDIKAAIERNAVLLVPVACLEQHGPHLAIHVDIDNVTHMVRAVAEKLNPRLPALVGAPIWFSPGGAFDLKKFPGTMKMRRDIFKEALSDVLESYLRGGFKRIVVVNGHGGGTQLWIPEVVRYLRRDLPKLEYKDDWKMPSDARVAAFTWLALLSEFAADELKEIRKSAPGSGWHAGDVETSLQLYLRPDLVDMSKAGKGTMRVPSKFGSADVADWHRDYMIVGFPGKSVPGTTEGVFGDPTVASKELGEKLFNLAVRKTCEFVEEFMSFP